MDKAFMGISIRNPFYFKKENILKGLELVRNFDEFMIFVVDYPYRLSLQAFNGLEEREAERIALKEGEELRKFLAETTKQFEKVKVFSWKKLMNADYYNLLSEVKELEKSNEEFSKLIEGEFTGTVVSKVEGDERKKQLSKDFITEEIAMFASLAFRGFSTRVSKYPRSKSVDYFLKTKNKSLGHIQIN